MTRQSEPDTLDPEPPRTKLHVLIHCNQRQPDVLISSKKAVLGVYSDVEVAYEHGLNLCRKSKLRDDVMVYEVLSFDLDAEPIPTTYFSQRYYLAEDEKRSVEQRKVAHGDADV